MSAETQEQRRHEARARTRRAILEATEAAIVADGVERFSIRRLVDRCGYTAPTIYHYFGDKEGLLDAVLEARFRPLAQRMGRATRGDDPVDHIRAIALAFVRFALRYPAHYQLILMPRSPERPPPPAMEAVREHIERAWQALWDAGRLQTRDIEAAGQMIWSLAHGLISGRVLRPEGPWSPHLVEDSIDALLRGLVKDEPAAPSRGRPRTQKEPE